MSELFSREEQLARRLDQVLPPGKTSRPPRTSDPLVNLATQVSALPIAELPDAALQRMEARMLGAFDAMPRTQQQRPARRWAEVASRWAIAASLILALLTAGLIPASASSLPGDPLYLVKRVLERASLVLTTEQDARARLQLDHALRRAEEAQALQSRGQTDDILLAEALQGIQTARQSASPDVLASPEFQSAQARVLDLVILVAEQGDEDSQPAAAATNTASPTATSSPSLTATSTETATATPTSTPSATHTATATASASHTATATSSQTATASSTTTPSHTPSATPTMIPSLTPTIIPTSTRTLAPTRTPHPTRTTDPCPGNSCNSSGVPGGVIDPQNPPGQSGGRTDCPGNSCDAPGQSEGSNSGGNGNGNSNAGGNGNGNGNGNAGGNGNGNGGGNGNGNGKLRNH